LGQLGMHLTQVAPRSCGCRRTAPRTKCSGAALAACVGSVRRPIRPTVTVFRAPSRRATPDGPMQAACAHFGGGRPAVATPTHGGYLSQVHTQLAQYED
jgi:hypothetical protein